VCVGGYRFTDDVYATGMKLLTVPIHALTLF